MPELPKRWRPHDYQVLSLKKMLANSGQGLFLVPGMGKTSVTLAAISVLLKERAITGALVIAPLRVVHGVWQQEAAKWLDFGHLRIQIVHGTPKQRRLALTTPADVYVTNPENVPWLVESGWTPPEMLVLDESTKFKNTRSKRFRALKKWLTRGLLKRRVILTGTPAPNGYEDLFGQIYMLDGGEALGKYITHFRMKYMVQDYRGFGWTMRPGAEELIREKIKHLVVWVDPDESLDMPELTQVQVPVTLPKKAREMYDDLERDFVIEIQDELVTAFTAGTLSGKLRQCANGSVYGSGIEHNTLHLHDAKIDALVDLKEELGGEPLLVAYEFRSDAQRIKEAFNCPLVGGGISTSKANEYIDAWNAGELPVLAIHPASGGHGLNLQTGGRHLCWYGPLWDLELHDQMIARLWRQGQEKKVIIHYLMARGTIDHKIFGVLVRKDRTQQDMLKAFRADTSV